jgi:hypothetical protein
MRFLLLSGLACLAAAVGVDAQRSAGPRRASAPARLLVATADDPALGELVRFGGRDTRPGTLGPTPGSTRLRRFGSHVWTIAPNGRAVTRVRTDGTDQELFDFGPDSNPQDVHVVGPVAYVSLREDPSLWRIVPSTGATAPVVDLSGLARPGEELFVGTLERDGDRLFVQVELEPDPATGKRDRGVLAVVDLATETLIDVDPIEPGTQGVALRGAPPHLEMQVLPADRGLFVSTTNGRLDNRGGIERVDLDALESTGFVLTEDRVGADLGGFVMLTPTSGFFVFHTDIVASTHLKPFDEEGAPPGPEIVFLLGAAVDQLIHDPVGQRLFLPTGPAFVPSVPGFFTIDLDRQEAVEFTPTSQRAHDALLLRGRAR